MKVHGKIKHNCGFLVTLIHSLDGFAGSGTKEAIMSYIFVKDPHGNKVFSFDTRGVKHWNAPRNCFNEAEFEDLYLDGDKWVHHPWDIFTLIKAGTRPNFATLYTKEQARDRLLAKEMPLPEELSDLSPTPLLTSSRIADGAIQAALPDRPAGSTE